MSAERWLPVVGYETLYEVSDRGRIKSLRSGRLMKQTLSNTTGYLVLNLSKSRKAKSHRVHQVVARAFIGKQRTGMQIDHVNGIKADNRLCNLEYVTPRENDRRATVMGLKASGDRNGSRTRPDRLPRGDRHHWAKLTSKEVGAVKMLVVLGWSHPDAARLYNVSRSLVSRIMSGDVRGTRSV